MLRGVVHFFVRVSDEVIEVQQVSLWRLSCVCKGHNAKIALVKVLSLLKGV